MNYSEKQYGEKIREEIMKCIISYIEEHQYPPSLREIGEMVGLSSSSSVHNHMKKLIASGEIETDMGDSFGLHPRAYRVPGYKFTKEGMQRHG